VTRARNIRVARAQHWLRHPEFETEDLWRSSILKTFERIRIRGT
jgi:hypothetical protein